MSTQPLRCSACDRDCVYDRLAPFGPEQETTYAVAWRCPECNKLSLDVCPIGPLVPARGLCLNCGTPYPSDAAEAECGECGLSRRACPAALGLEDGAAESPNTSAHAAFAQGLFRRGMATLNQAIQQGVELPEPWLLKASFLNSIGFNRTAAEMLGSAVARFSSSAERIELLEEQSFLWAECQRGEEALRSADATVQLGSNSVRTHYLRGRALALLGRLEEARNEMNQVLALDSNNSDAHRALKMIEAALQPNVNKPWWQFWK